MSAEDTTVTLKHHSHAGRLWINGVGEVDPDEEFEVSTAEGWTLLEQSDLYEQVAGPTPPPPATGLEKHTVAELQDLARGAGIEALPGWKKQDYVDALAAAAANTEEESK
ncbi:MAG TPA: hypothetical protein VGM94_15130 [Galbitalea sp.]|jgi:hypothetical protein